MNSQTTCPSCIMLEEGRNAETGLLKGSLHSKFTSGSSFTLCAYRGGDAYHAGFQQQPHQAWQTTDKLEQRWTTVMHHVEACNNSLSAEPLAQRLQYQILNASMKMQASLIREVCVAQIPCQQRAPMSKVSPALLLPPSRPSSVQLPSAAGSLTAYLLNQHLQQRRCFNSPESKFEPQALQSMDAALSGANACKREWLVQCGRLLFRMQNPRHS